MDYKLTRSKRKTCAIYIRNNAVEVRAPLRMKQADIDRFVEFKADWINKKLSESAVRKEKRSAFELTYGDTVLYRGKELLIIAKPGDRVGLSDESFFIPPEQIKSACIQVYRLLAKSVLTEKLSAFADIMGVSPAAVKVGGAKTRWGSCSGKKNLNFSWRLMMANDPVIDYIVVHELAHLKEMNHSSRFWAEVEKVLPDYKMRQKVLKALQKRLSMEDWDEI